MTQMIKFPFERKWGGESRTWKKTSPTLPWPASYAIRGFWRPDSQENFSCNLPGDGV
jgi:hypothetical protein